MSCSLKQKISLQKIMTIDIEKSFSDMQTLDRLSPKRFRRTSNNKSRSKSIEREISPNQAPKFFIKNICKQNVTNNQDLLKKIRTTTQHLPNSNPQRESTPVKQRSLIRKPISQIGSDLSPHEELHIFNLQQKLQVVVSENIMLQEKIKVLQEQLSKISQKVELESIKNQPFIQQNRHQQGQKNNIQDNGKNGKNALQALKRQIAENKNVEIAYSCDYLQKQNKILQFQNNKLKERIRAMQQFSQKKLTEKQKNMEKIIENLRKQIGSKNEIINKLNIQINVLHIRLNKEIEKIQIIRSEQMQTLKKKYGKILQKNYNLTQQLAAYRRIKVKKQLFFDRTDSKISLDSLSFSPELNEILNLKNEIDL